MQAERASPERLAIDAAMTPRTQTTTGAAPPVSVAARLLPSLTTLLAGLVALQSVHLPGYWAVTPAFALMAVYHWTVYRPDLLSPMALFGIGLLYDLLAGGPPGVTSLLFLCARIAVLHCRRWLVGRPFPLVWGGFTLLTAAAMVGLWLVQSALVFRFVGLSPSIYRAVLTISLFPIVSFLLGRLQRALIGEA